MKKILITILFTTAVLFAAAQDAIPVTFSYSSTRISLKEAVVQIKAEIKKGWKRYAQQNTGPFKLNFYYPGGAGASLLGNTSEPLTESGLDANQNMHVNYYKSSATFSQRIRTKTPTVFFRGEITYTASNGEETLGPITIPFSLMVR